MSSAPKIIAFVSDAIWPYNKGGKEKRLHDISTRLAERGYDVHIFCMKWWDGAEKSRVENGVTLHGICPYVPLYSGGRRSIRQALIFAAACLSLVNYRFDLIDADHMPFFQLFTLKIVSLIKRKPLVVTWNEVWGLAYWREYLGLGGYIAYFIEKLSVKLPDRIVAVSDLTADRLRDWLGAAIKIDIIPIGVDVEKIKRIKPAKDRYDVIFVGRLLGHKHVDVLIDAINYLKDKGKRARCLIIGEGPEKSRLMSQTDGLDLSELVKFRGKEVGDTMVYALMKSAKVLVLPSTREGYGIIVLEAFACGIPVIVVDHPDNAAKYLISRQNGTIVKLSAVDLADAIGERLNRNNLPFRITTSVKQYEWRKQLVKVEQVYLS